LPEPYRVDVDFGNVGIEPTAVPVPYLLGWRIWESFVAVWDSPKMPVVVEMHVEVVDGHPKCTDLHVQARPGEGVTSASIRKLPVATLLDDAVAAAVMKEDGDGKSNLFKSGADFRAYRVLKRPQRERQRWQLTPEFLDEVLEVYERGHPRGVIEVAQHYGRPRATASHWIQRAKAEQARKGKRR